MCRPERVDGPGLSWILCCAELAAHEEEHVFGLRQATDRPAIQQVAGERGHAVRCEPIPSAAVCKPADGQDLEVMAGLVCSAAGQYGQCWPHLSTCAKDHQRTAQPSNKLHQLRSRTSQNLVELVFGRNRLRRG